MILQICISKNPDLLGSYTFHLQLILDYLQSMFKSSSFELAIAQLIGCGKKFPESFKPILHRCVESQLNSAPFAPHKPR